MRTYVAGGQWMEVAIIANPSLGIGVGGRIIDTSEVSLMEERKPIALPSPLGVEVLGEALRLKAGGQRRAAVASDDLPAAVFGGNFASVE